MTAPIRPVLQDQFARAITYLRVSVTDRCDLRCTYCMSERQTFVPKLQVLTLEELDRLCRLFIDRGVTKLRITGGEPLVRRDVLSLMERLSSHLSTYALSELTLTTNGTQLARYAATLRDMGVERINVSLDSLTRAKFAQLTRRDVLLEVLNGIDTAQRVGLKVKINTVALAGEAGNESELPHLIEWAHAQGMDITLIETMPLGETGYDRNQQFLSVSNLAQHLASFWTLTPIASSGNGPARTFQIGETGGRLGLITPMSHGFCGDCNRVRLTCTGRLHLCLGQEDYVDLGALLRAGASDNRLHEAIDVAMLAKPLGHSFEEDWSRPHRTRSMSMTGG
jgi:GTP 3',8-cyclase